MIKQFVLISAILLGFTNISFAADVPTINPGSFDNSTVYKSEQESMVFEKFLGLTYDTNYVKIIGAQNGFILVKYWSGETKVLPANRIFNPVKYKRLLDNFISERTFDGSTSIGESRYITVVSPSDQLLTIGLMGFQIYSAKVLSEENGYLTIQSTGGSIYKIPEQEMFQTKNGTFAGLRWGVGYYFVRPINMLFGGLAVPLGHFAYKAYYKQWLSQQDQFMSSRNKKCADFFEM